jgi:hypothetical protein
MHALNCFLVEESSDGFLKVFIISWLGKWFNIDEFYLVRNECELDSIEYCTL